MGKINFKGLVNQTKTVLDKHSPEILTSMGIAGMFAMTVMSVKATPKALQLIEEKKKEYDTDELTNREVIQACWKCYIPAGITGGISVACLIGANTVNSRRNAVLATAYKLSETTLHEYRNKVVEVIGEKEEKEIRDKIAQDKIDKNPVKDNVVIASGGDVLCYETISGRYFKSTIQKLKKAENVLNKRMMSDVYVSLNDLYDLIDLPFTQMGHELGWTFEGDMLEFDFSATISDTDEPCLVIDYSTQPKSGYQNLY